MSPCTELLSRLECSWASDLVTSLPRDLQAVTDPQPIWVMLKLASPTHRLKLTFPGHPGGTVRDSTWEQGATGIPAPSDPWPLALFPQMLSCLEHMYHDLGLVRDFSINPITLRRWLVSGSSHLDLPLPPITLEWDCPACPGGDGLLGSGCRYQGSPMRSFVPSVLPCPQRREERGQPSGGDSQGSTRKQGCVEVGVPCVSECVRVTRLHKRVRGLCLRVWKCLCTGACASGSVHGRMCGMARVYDLCGGVGVRVCLWEFSRAYLSGVVRSVRGDT